MTVPSFPVPGYPKGNVIIPGPAGGLEGIAWETEGAARWAVLSHGHPLHGGVMHFKVLFRAARILQARGYGVVRYNFRGVGHSEGTHDGGRGEADDLRAVLSWIEERHGVRDVLLSGFSFGAWISARVGREDPRARGLLLFSVVERLIADGSLAGIEKPVAVVQGDGDAFGPWPVVEAAVAALPRARLIRVEGADHFFTGRMAELERAVEEALDFLDGA